MVLIVGVSAADYNAIICGVIRMPVQRQGWIDGALVLCRILFGT